MQGGNAGFSRKEKGLTNVQICKRTKVECVELDCSRRYWNKLVVCSIYILKCLPFSALPNHFESKLFRNTQEKEEEQKLWFLWLHSFANVFKVHSSSLGCFDNLEFFSVIL